METGILKKGDTVYSTEISSGLLYCEVLELIGNREQCATVRTATGKTYDVMVSTCSLASIYPETLTDKAKNTKNCYFDNDSIERQKEKAINFQVRFLTDERLCELRKRLGEAYENARVVGFIRKDGVYELKCDNVSQRTIDKIVEKIAVYTKQNFPELIIEEL